MFQSSRDECERAIEWIPKSVQYVEAWNYSNENVATPSTLRHGCLEPGRLQIEQWLHHQGQFSCPTPSPSAGSLQGGVRLLICNRPSFAGISVGLSKEDFRAIESVFKLHPATLPTLAISGGTFSRHIKYSSSGHSKIDKISILLKAPQKREVANYMLSLTYDTASQWTTALLIGESIVDLHTANYGESSCAEYFPLGAIRRMLNESIELWNNPLLLPCIIMSDHLSKLLRFCDGPLTEQVMSIEDQLGIVRAGRRGKDGMPGGSTRHNYALIDQKFKRGEPVQKSQVMDLTIAINTQFTRVLFSKRSPIWNHEASDFLIATFEELEGKLENASRDRNQISERLEHNIHIAKSVESHVIGLQTRLDVQLNVLYSFVAQTDNRLTARLAATSGRDSTSMKILAFITTIFLPGTFIATLFSMSMFNWQYDGVNNSSISGGAVVSSRFWIYWVVTVPLTLLTLLGWALWWSLEKKRYDIDVAETLTSAERFDEPSWWRRLTWKKDSSNVEDDKETAMAQSPEQIP